MANIVDNFVKAKVNTKVTADMIVIACDRLSNVAASDVSLKASLTQLLSLLNDIIQSAEDLDTTTIALECIGKLSRVHGKAQLLLFEPLLPTIVDRGIERGNDLAIENASNCLTCMLYL